MLPLLYFAHQLGNANIFASVEYLPSFDKKVSSKVSLPSSSVATQEPPCPPRWSQTLNAEQRKIVRHPLKKILRVTHADCFIIAAH